MSAGVNRGKQLFDGFGLPDDDLCEFTTDGGLVAREFFEDVPEVAPRLPWLSADRLAGIVSSRCRWWRGLGIWHVRDRLVFRVYGKLEKSQRWA